MYSRDSKKTAKSYINQCLIDYNLKNKILDKLLIYIVV